MEVSSGYGSIYRLCMYGITTKQHIYLDDSHKKTYLVTGTQNKISQSLLSRWYLAWSVTPNKHEGQQDQLCLLPSRKQGFATEERAGISAEREQLGRSPCDSWTGNFSANFQGGLAILRQLTQLSSLLLMVWYHVALFSNRNSMLKFTQQFPHAFPLAF